MSYPVGRTVTREDGSIEIIFRCPFCGDTEREGRGHLSVNPMYGKYYCFRCGFGGNIAQLPEDILEKLVNFDVVKEYRQKKTSQVILYSKGAGLQREVFYGLDRFHTVWDGRLCDVFELRNLKGNVTGIHIRSNDKSVMFTSGTGLIYAGKDLISSVSSSFCLFVVEGPYDVLHYNWVATCGIPNDSHVQMLRPFPVYLVPDGDVWDKKDLLRSWLKPWKKHPTVLGVLKLPEDKDPDDFHPFCRREGFVPFVDVLTYDAAWCYLEELYAKSNIRQ